MIKTVIFSIIFVSFSYSSTNSARVTLENIMQTDDLLSYFDNVFESLGIKIEDTGEEFTVLHTGNEFIFKDGIKKDSVDFIVPLKSINIQNMVQHSKDGKIDKSESWRILDVLFTPLTQVTLQNPVMSVNWRRKLAGVEDLTHVYLINPNGKEASKHTLIYVKGQWLVLKGIHGSPKRTYRMTPEESLDYQRNVFNAIKADNLWDWFKFSLWYKKWRKNNSVTH
tara:strand:- start:51 stop:722 length:672 start_codon:yes stop_codon:yes gene_type:complete